MITIEHLSKTYRKGAWALLDVSLQLDKGMTGLLGPNGAGKTTLMRILATLLTPTSGQVRVNGISIGRPEEIRQMIGYLPQHFHIYPQLTGRDYLDYVAAMKGITERGARQKEISRLLEMVNLQGKADKKVRTYSGGMKQRLGIAQALLGSPDILIVDEPTSGLDPQERVRFRNVLTRFSIDRTVLLSTHIVADIESNCRRIAVMNKGRLAMNGSLAELQACGKGQVWEAVMSPDEFALIDPMSVVSTRTVPEGVLCRFIGQAAPVAGAFPADPTLEDGYLSLLRRDRHA
ncbi:ABC transporter ATP-binding protein [Virgibacillus sp. LDC1]|uniref:ABC transporter ATP-binding protein n=1 Tax=Paenibacillus TaxID=44249 RepID=UPI000C27B139|nr:MULTISPECIES: ABC transporter ATP-binding protein [Paenibacillus]MCV4235625.1 ABC transporter ATP-binding protein [Virgibacillus sp. LDC1]MEC0259477.1 ABC transporter ATP-binding protein [Paenibacillus lautus]MEC0309597.1 ABC transporter ATP-binding protein [Paenibacillus lautus]PJN48684.1 putative ABC transporter ATP-binding protein YxlF [Paenibacillus sp. GM2FR]